MKITDSPFAAGTPEHNEWVRNTFIPIENSFVNIRTGAGGRAGIEGSAESQGRNVIVGRWGDAFDENGELVRDSQPWIIIDDPIKPDHWTALNGALNYSFVDLGDWQREIVDRIWGSLFQSHGMGFAVDLVPEDDSPTPEEIVADATKPYTLPEAVEHVDPGDLPRPLWLDAALKETERYAAQPCRPHGNPRDSCKQCSTGR